MQHNKYIYLLLSPRIDAAILLQNYLPMEDIVAKEYVSQDAFTLVELAIVIVIIGLIIAGVLAGQSLVQQTKLRATISDVQKF